MIDDAFNQKVRITWNPKFFFLKGTLNSSTPNLDRQIMELLKCLAYAAAASNGEFLQVQIGLWSRKGGMCKLGLLLIGSYGGNGYYGGCSHQNR